MLISSLWSRNDQGYSLVEGAAVGGSSTTHRPCYGSGGDYDGHGKLSRRSLSSLVVCLVRRHRQRMAVVLGVVAALGAAHAVLRMLFMPPAYVVLAPDAYVDILEKTVRDRMPLESSSSRAAMLANLQALREPDGVLQATTNANSSSLVPDNLFSSDKQAPPSDWASKWHANGFQTQFYSDEEADAWVESEWKGTQVVTAWREMPRMILCVACMGTASGR